MNTLLYRKMLFDVVDRINVFYTPASGQKKLADIGRVVSSSPLLVSTVTVRFMSGCTLLTYSLNALASLASRAVSTKLLIVLASLSPLTEVIICLSLVDISGLSFLFIFLSPSSSLLILLLSPTVNILNVINFRM